MSECIEWPKSKSRGGYGRRWWCGKIMRAHRVVFYEYHGYWPEVVRHTCDNPGCINVEHLLPGTQQDNVDDRVSRGRGNNAKGSAQGLSKLVESDILEIRQMIKEGYTQRYIARRYDVAQTQVSLIKTGKNWSHVIGPVPDTIF